MSAQSRVSARQRVAGDNGDVGLHPATLTVRPAGRSDLVPLSFFFDTVLRRDYFVRRGQLEDLVAGRYHQVYVAEIDAVLVGVAITTRGSRLVNALVHPAYRGLGIGRKLVDYSGATEVRAKLDMSSGDPRGFYRALGFRSTGVRNGKGNVELLRLPRVVEAGRSRRSVRRGGGENVREKHPGNNGAAASRRRPRK